MTSIEARQKIDACEVQIVSAHNGLKNSARSVGTNALSEASRNTTMNTLLPLILCVIGLFCFTGPWFLGVILIALGAYLSYLRHNSAMSTQTQIVSMQKNLNTTIDNNPSI